MQYCANCFSLTTQAPSPDSSFVFIPELPADIKYPPSIQSNLSLRKRPGHYLQIAHTLGESRHRSRSNVDTRFKRKTSPPSTTPNPYVESLHSKLASKRHRTKSVERMDTDKSSSGSSKHPNSLVEAIHSKLSPRVQSHEPIVWLKNVAITKTATAGTKVARTTMKEGQGRRNRYRNEYVEGIHSKLAGRKGSGHRHGDKRKRYIRVCIHPP